MFNKYYQQELQKLRELAVEFSKEHPVVAPMLRGPTPDADVERLLEGVAFLNGLLQEKLNDEFPEIVQGLMDVVFPHYLCPIPSMSIVKFTAKQNLKETITVPAGVSLASTPVDGTPCIFKTCFETEVHPLHLISAETKAQTSESNQLTMALQLTGLNLSQWKPKGLMFFLGRPSSQATDLFMLLTRYLRQIIIKPHENGNACVLEPECLVSTGFEQDNNLLPFPTQAFSGYRLIREYFVMPSKLLFMELRGWENWKNRGDGTGFEVTFDFLPSPVPIPSITTSQIVLFAAPVINLFKMDAEPVVFDHHSEKIRIKPAGVQSNHCRIYDIIKVTGFTQGDMHKTEYAPLEFFCRSGIDKPIYQVMRSRSPVDDSPEIFLSFPYRESDTIEQRTQILSVELNCTNGALPERLALGNICVETSDSPEFLTFENIIPTTAIIDPPLERNVLWKFLAHLSLNYLSIADTDNLRDMLSLYVPDSRDKWKVEANMKKIAGILNITVTPDRRLFRGNMIQGHRIDLLMNKDYYGGFGSLYHFASMLDGFFGIFSAMHTFTRLSVKESNTGEIFTWLPRMGTRYLI